jgi:RimJ/RimL family protein N-acetyltransferase
MQLVYPLTTERLIIRALTTDDLDRHHALFSDPEVVRYLYFGPFDRPAAQEHLARRSTVDLPIEGQWINFGVEVKDEGILIGELAMGFISSTHAHYEVGYVFDPAYAGRGYATEGAAMIVELAFSGLGAHRVSGRLDARNDPSARVLEKLGMRREAHFIENEFVKGEWTDELAYAILAPEWRALRGPAPEIQFYGSSPSKGDALRAD